MDSLLLVSGKDSDVLKGVADDFEEFDQGMEEDGGAEEDIVEVSEAFGKVESIVAELGEEVVGDGDAAETSEISVKLDSV